MTIGLTPGVYVEDVTGPGAIEGVPTWGVAFLGHTCLDLPAAPTLVTSKDDFKAKFGAPVWGAYLHWAVSKFFDNGGLYCWVLGVKHDGDTAANAGLVLTSSTNDENTGQPDTTTFEAASSGLWGNLLWLSVGITPGNPNAKPLAGLTTITVCVLDADINPAFQKQWTSDKLKLASLADRNWLWAFVQANTNSIDTVYADLSDQDKHQKIYILESFAGLSISNMNAIQNALNRSSSFVRCTSTYASLAFATGWYPLGGGSSFTYPSQTGAALTDTPGANSGITGDDYATALEALAGIQGISTIATPDVVVIEGAVNTDTNNPSLSTQSNIVGAVASACEEPGRYWFYVVDPPVSLGAEDTVSFKNGTYDNPADNAVASSYAALFWPYLTVAHPTTGKFFRVPPSGAVAGRFVYTDINVGVHQAAAGVNFGALSNVSSLGVDEPITDGLQDAVYPDGLNVIRNRIHYGICIWGCRTLSYDPNWEHIPVRRLFNYVEKSLVEGLQQFVFDVNNVHLWVRVTRDVTWFLIGLWKNGALFGRTQADAFRVTCDETNNTSETMQQGYLYVKVEIAPVHPAEFIVIQISQKMANANSGS